MDTIDGKRRRNKRWPMALKREIVEATLQPGASVSVVARQYDVNANQVFGWSMSTTLHTDVVLAALNMALAQRKPDRVIHHSDQGSQGGINSSSQHSDVGGCDDYCEATLGPIRTAVSVLSGATIMRATRTPVDVLARDSVWPLKRRLSDRCRSIASNWSQVVPGGRRHATNTSLSIGKADVRAISFVRRARGYSASLRARARGTSDRPKARAGALHDLP